MRFLKEDTYEKLLQLLQKTFQMNSHSDNCAYWLDFYGFVNTQDIVHSKYAHMFPELADKISDLMTKLNVRPKRLALEADDKDYENYVLLFADIYNKFVEYQNFIIEVIDIAEMNEDKEVVIFLENYLDNLYIFLKQTRIWKDKAETYGIDKDYCFDKDFDKFVIV
jgi:ferritin